MLYFNTNKQHGFFFGFFLQNTSCIRKPQVISGGDAHPLHPPPRSVPVRPTNIYYQFQFHLTFVPVIHGVLTYCCIRPQVVVVVVFIVDVFVLILSTEMQPYTYSSDSKVLKVTFYSRFALSRNEK